MKRTKRFLSGLLAVALACTMLPMTVFATDSDIKGEEYFKTLVTLTNDTNLKQEYSWSTHDKDEVNVGTTIFGCDYRKATFTFNIDSFILQRMVSNSAKIEISVSGSNRDDHRVKLNKNQIGYLPETGTGKPGSRTYNVRDLVVGTNNVRIETPHTDTCGVSIMGVKVSFDLKPVYTVKFDSNGGSAVNDKANVIIGSKISPISTEPKKDGYTFMGWYKEKELQNQWNFEKDTVASNITLYAKWNYANRTYGVYHYSPYLKDGDYDTQFTNKEFTNSELTEADIKALVNEYDYGQFEGYDLWGYKPNNSTKYKIATKDDSTTLKASYDVSGYKYFAIHLSYKQDEITHTVAFNSNGGSDVKSITGIRNKRTITAPTEPKKDGYKFMGWYKEPTLQNKWDFDTDTVKSKITLYAKWEKDDNQTFSYKVEYYKDEAETPFETLKDLKVAKHTPTVLGNSIETKNMPVGYKLAKAIPETTTITATNNIIKVNYVKDPNQTFSYKVEYYKDEAETPFETLKDLKVAKHTPTVLGSSIETKNMPVGYKLAKAIPETTTITATNNIIKVNYVKDPNQTFSYKVEYYKDEAETPFETLKDLKVAKHTPTVLGSSIETKNMPVGYKLAKAIPETTTITATNNIIKVNYVKDPNQTFSYKVEYYKDEAETPFETLKDLKVAKHTPTVLGNSIETKNMPVGYKLAKAIPETTTITATNNIIKVNYVKDPNQTFSYKVEYYKDEAETPFETLKDLKVAKHTPTVLGSSIETKNMPVGYKLAKAIPETTTITATNNIIKVNYVKDPNQTFSYKVEYYKDEAETPFETLKDLKVAKHTPTVLGSSIETKNMPVGYKLAKAIPETTTITATNNIIKVNYVKDPNQTFSYKVEYYKDEAETPFETLKDLKVAKHTPTVLGSSIETKNMPVGYKLAKAIPETTTITATNNIIKVNYVKDPNQTFSYKVEYYKDEAETPFETLKDLKVAKHTPTVLGSSIETKNMPVGYKLAKAIPETTTITATNNIIKVNYVKDPNQTFSYKVEYYKDEAKTPFETLKDLKVAKHTPTVLGSSIETKNMPVGYKLAKAIPETTTITATNNIIKVNYVKDPNQTFSYKVEYYKDEAETPFETLKDLKVAKHTPTVLGSSIETKNMPVGYKLAKAIPETTTITATNNIIKVNYVKDPNQTFSYKVEYYKDEAETPFETLKDLKVAKHTPTVLGSSIETKNMPVGYKLAKAIPETTTITATNNIIKVNYVKDPNQTFSYKVEYYKDEAETPFETLKDLKVAKHTPTVLGSSIETKNMPVGYKLAKAIPETTTITATNNIIKVNYVKDPNQTFSYKVEYYKDEAETPFETLKDLKVAKHTPTVLGSSIETKNMPVGYKLAKAIPETTTITATNNIIKVNYVKDPNQTFSYKVEYYKDEAETPFETLKDLKVAKHTPTVLGSSIETKNMPVGYKLAKAIPETTTITATNNIIKVNYVKDPNQTFSYKVEYYKDEAETPFETLKDLKVAKHTPTVLGSSIETKNMPVGYKLAKAIPETTTITATNNIIKVNYVKDPNQTFSYKVEYYKDEAETPFETLKDLKVAKHTPTVLGNSIETKNMPVGYKLAKAIPETTTITATNNIIKVNYVKDPNQTFSYKVEYYKDEAETPFETLKDLKVAKHTPTVLGSSIETKNMPVGYKLAKAIPETITITATNNIIKVLYVVDNKTKLSYSVSYYINGTIVPNLEYYGSVTLAKPIVNSGDLRGEGSGGLHGQYLKGCLFEKTIPATPFEVTANNVNIGVYYNTTTTDVIPVTHNYYLNNSLQSSTTNNEPLPSQLQDFNTTQWQKAINGYSFSGISIKRVLKDMFVEIKAFNLKLKGLQSELDAEKAKVENADGLLAEYNALFAKLNQKPAKVEDKVEAILPPVDQTLPNVEAILPPVGEVLPKVENKSTTSTATVTMAEENVIPVDDKAKLAEIEARISTLLELQKQIDAVMLEKAAAEAELNQEMMSFDSNTPLPKEETTTGLIFNYDPRYIYTVTINYSQTTSSGNTENNNNNNSRSNNNVYIPEEEVPLAKVPDDIVTIVDKSVPLGKLPKAGGLQAPAIGGIAFMALIASFLLKLKKRED